MELNEKIKALREDHDLTQKELGKITYMSQRKISHIEKGRTEPNIEDLKMICKTFQISADYLIGLPEGMPYPKR